MTETHKTDPESMIHTLGHTWLKRNIILHAFFKFDNSDNSNTPDGQLEENWYFNNRRFKNNDEKEIYFQQIQWYNNRLYPILYITW